MSKLTLVGLIGGTPHPTLDAWADAAANGARASGWTTDMRRLDGARSAELTEIALEADALLWVTPIVLGGWPGTTKLWLDSWLELLPRGRLTPRTAGKRSGYLAIYEPDDDAIPASFDASFRVLSSLVGFEFCGKLARPPRAPSVASDLEIAHRLGAILTGEPGYAGYPDEYERGVACFNDREFWQAHEEWEALWLEATGARRVFLQGLIQVAAALHHFGHENWGGMLALLRGGMAKLESCRPGIMGVDVDEFLEQLGDWRTLAEARAGNTPVVMRKPAAPPHLKLKR